MQHSMSLNQSFEEFLEQLQGQSTHNRRNYNLRLRGFLEIHGQKTAAEIKRLGYAAWVAASGPDDVYSTPMSFFVIGGEEGIPAIGTELSPCTLRLQLQSHAASKRVVAVVLYPKDMHTLLQHVDVFQ